MNDQLIQYWKLGKLKIDIDQLDSFNKVKYVKIENLINGLIKLKEDIDKIMLEFGKGG